MSRLLLAFVVLSLVPTATGLYNVLVRARTGDVEGFTMTTQYEAKFTERINVFLGIPYAKRPEQFPDGIKDFRFKKPEPPFWYGIWDATKYKPACPQEHWLARETIPDFQEMDEDCLYLNIFAPNKTDEHPSSNPPLYPVMVFIHGGGWNMGTSQQYPGMFLAERNIVVVTLNYRLNALDSDEEFHGFTEEDLAEIAADSDSEDEIEVEQAESRVPSAYDHSYEHNCLFL